MHQLRLPYTLEASGKLPCSPVSHWFLFYFFPLIICVGFQFYSLFLLDYYTYMRKFCICGSDRNMAITCSLYANRRQRWHIKFCGKKTFAISAYHALGPKRPPSTLSIAINIEKKGPYLCDTFHSALRSQILMKIVFRGYNRLTEIDIKEVSCSAIIVKMSVCTKRHSA